MRRISLMIMTAVALFSAAQSAQADTIAFFTDFNSGAPAQFSGVTTVAAVPGGLSGMGPAGNTFGGQLLVNNTGGPNGQAGSPTTLTLTGLGAHTAIDLNFLLVAIDSWDGAPGSFPQNDILDIRVDGVLVFSKSFANQSGTSDYTPPAGGLLSGPANLGFNAAYFDSAYNMYLEPTLGNIAHTASSVSIAWNAHGVGWQGGEDESWGLDNVQVVLRDTSTSVPEPTSLVLLGLGSSFLAGIRWKAKRNKD